jgi:hypothetical protein
MYNNNIIAGYNCSPHPNLTTPNRSFINTSNINTEYNNNEINKMENDTKSVEITPRGGNGQQVYAYLRVSITDLERVKKLIENDEKKREYHRNYMRKNIDVKKGRDTRIKSIEYDIFFS